MKLGIIGGQRPESNRRNHRYYNSKKWKPLSATRQPNSPAVRSTDRKSCSCRATAKDTI